MSTRIRAGRYVRHVDNTCTAGRGRLCNGRRLTAVYYLNGDWQEGHGGELRILGKGPEGGPEAPLLDVAPKLDRRATPLWRVTHGLAQPGQPVCAGAGVTRLAL